MSQEAEDRMAGRKTFDADAAEDAAMRVFWDRGYADASVDVLGAAMGLGRGSFYNAFGDKAALFARALTRYGERYGSRYEQALASGSDVRGALTAFFDVTLDRIADPSVPLGCLVAQSVVAAPSLPDAAAAQAVALLGTQRERIGRLLVDRGTEAAAADGVALQLAAVNQSLAVLSRAGVGTEELRGVVRAAVDAAVHTVRAAVGVGTVGSVAG